MQKRKAYRRGAVGRPAVLSLWSQEQQDDLGLAVSKGEERPVGGEVEHHKRMR